MANEKVDVVIVGAGASGAAFALSAVGYRGAALALGDTPFALAAAFSLLVASVPLTVSFTSDGETPAGNSTRTSASPPVTISGRLDNTRTCNWSAAPPTCGEASTTTLIAAATWKRRSIRLSLRVLRDRGAPS